MNLNQLFLISPKDHCHFCNSPLSPLFPFSSYVTCSSCNNFVIAYSSFDKHHIASAFVINDLQYYFYKHNPENIIHPYKFSPITLQFAKCKHTVHIPINSFTSIPDAYIKISKLLFLS